jgi:transposase
VAGDRKKAAEEERTIVFIDEAGFCLLAAAVLTYAPRGQTPILRFPLTRDHLSVIGAITPDGRLYILLQERAFKGPDMVRFLCHLLRHMEGQLLIVWDGLPAHHGPAVRDFLSQGGTRRIHLERLPGYAPDLNPTEGIWHYLKDVELKNLCCHDLAELRDELRKAINRLRRKTPGILSCIHHVHLGGSV